MRMFIQCMLASGVALMGACASIPKSYMLVPSRTTVHEFEQLSHQSGTTVDVLTVNREERQILLDGAGGNALTGHQVGAPAAPPGSESVVRIPFDELALVYYSHGRMPDKDVYPSLQYVGVVEQSLSCDELAVDLARAETIRWYARRQGAVPFTAHEAMTQHGKNFLLGVGETLIVVAALAGGVGGGASSPSADEHSHASAEAYRWAVTAADRRIIALLELKQQRSCAALQTRSGGDTDLTLLSHIEDLRQALAIKQISDRDQRDQQTKLLDQNDPLLPTSEQADFAGAVRVYEHVTWYPNVDATGSLSSFVAKPLWQGEMKLTDGEVVFRPKSGERAPSGEAVRLPYADLADVVVTDHFRWRGVVMTQRDGHKDSFCIVHGLGIDREATQAAGDFLKSRVSAVSH